MSFQNKNLNLKSLSGDVMMCKVINPITPFSLKRIFL